MQIFSDILVICCLFTSGFFFGYYCKFVYIYDNLWTHWHMVLGVVVALSLAAVWTFRKYRKKQYRFDHFYVIMYGLICFVISGCFMLADNLDISFYFGFIGIGTIFVPCFSFISLRSSSQGKRPARIALGNTAYFAGLTTGFSIFNELESEISGWIYVGVTTATIVGVVANEILQHLGVSNYKRSCDLVFNLMNDEKLVFAHRKSIHGLYVSREEFYLARNRQWLVVGVSSLIIMERVFLFSVSYLQLMWSSTVAYLHTQYLYAPFLLHAIGCGLGSLLMIRHKPKLLYLMLGLIKITALAAVLGIYSENMTENCFLFQSLYYMSMGVYSSIALQMVLECTPFLFTEVALALAFAVELLVLESLKYETNAENAWYILLGMGIGIITLTAVCMIVIQFCLPRSQGLIDVRNKLLGIRRHQPVQTPTKIWNTNTILHRPLEPHEVTSVRLAENRVFQQYPADIKKERQF